MKLCKWQALMEAQFVINDFKVLAKETHLSCSLWISLRTEPSALSLLPAGAYSSSLGQNLENWDPTCLGATKPTPLGACAPQRKDLTWCKEDAVCHK